MMAVDEKGSLSTIWSRRGLSCLQEGGRHSKFRTKPAAKTGDGRLKPVQSCVHAGFLQELKPLCCRVIPAEPSSASRSLSLSLSLFLPLSLYLSIYLSISLSLFPPP